MGISSEIASYWSQKLKEEVDAFTAGKYFDTIYYEPVKPRWIPWRIWFWMLKRYFTHRVIWMEEIKSDKGRTTAFTCYMPLERTDDTAQA